MKNQVLFFLALILFAAPFYSTAQSGEVTQSHNQSSRAAETPARREIT